MLIPSKHERLEKNLIVIGGDILTLLKKRDIWNVESLFRGLTETTSVSLDQYYNVITFLWLSDIIRVDKYNIYSKRKNATS